MLSKEEEKEIEKIKCESLNARTLAQLEAVKKQCGINEVKYITKELGQTAFLIHIIEKLKKEVNELSH
jgi:hypothetical protein